MTQQNRAEIVISAVDKATGVINQVSARLENAMRPVADLSKAFGNLYKATGLSAVGKAVGGLTDSLKGLATTTLGIATASVSAAGGVLLFANRAVDAADKIGDLSERYHIASKDLQVYGSLMEEAGVGTVEDAAASLGKLQKAMNEAIHGGKEQAAAFAGVGISIAELKKLRPDQVVERMADAFQGSDKDMAKQAVLLELMGKNGTAWMSIMDKGGTVIRERYQQMIADGRILSDEQIAQADRSDKAWRRMVGTIEGVKNALGLQLAEKLQPLIEGVQRWVVVNRELIQSKFDQFLAKLPALLDAGVELFSGLWSVLEGVVGAFSAISNVIGPTAALLLVVGGAMSPMILAAGQLFFALGKVGWIIGSLAVQAFPVLMSAVSGLAWLFNLLAGALLKDLATALRAVWALMLANPIGVLVAAVAGLAVVVYSNWDAIVAYVSAAWERIKSVFEVSFFDGVWQAALEGFQALLNGVLGMLKSVLPSFAMPKAFEQFQFQFATDRAQRLTAAQAAQSQRQDISNQISIKIDAEGRPRVTEMKPGSPQTQIDVMSGLSMVGA